MNKFTKIYSFVLFLCKAIDLYKLYDFINDIIMFGVNMIIFDLDGTLWNTENTTVKAANIVADSYLELFPISIDTVKRGMGLSIVENAMCYMPYLDIDSALFHINEINMENFKLITEYGAELYDNVLDTIKQLSKDYKIGIITNNNDDYVKIFLNNTGLSDYIYDYMGAASYNISKGEAIKRMINKHNALNSVYVGDIKKDMEASNEAGVNFIHARYGFDPNIDSKYYIDNILDLFNVLKEINVN